MAILVTGATGFLGGALTAELLRSDDWPDVLLLARAESREHAHERVLERLRRFAVGEEHLARIRLDQIVCADLASSDSLANDGRLGGVRRVVHCAASTSFGASEQVFNTNVDGTVRLARHLLEIAPVERFVYVSTAMICGRRPQAIVREDDYPQDAIDHLVTYTRSKAQAETRLRAMQGLPLVVARPSIIVGHTRLGCQPSGSIFWTFRVADALGMVTSSPDGCIDVVPVDYAARALLLLLRKESLIHSTYHISAAVAASCNWMEIARAFGQAQDAASANKYYRAVDVRDVAARKHEFDRLFGRCNKRFVMHAIRLYSAFADLNCVFANDRLHAESGESPPRFSDYLDVCLRSSAGISIAAQMLIDF